ncbi:FAD-dependent oxidoreductase [Brevibacterium renqingii]|uniref:FAD-dependent oxidoreductase n=1 Tax=Brevibacterium renqingii TaxID=2776916 RepID=UPI001AE012B0|nr:FAD-dependent oxidoreductase [Brevibacterium renqingii]
MRIAIVGAGIGGLSAAVGLQRAGAEVTVFERAPAVRAGGSGLSLFANGLKALEALGLREEFETVTDRGVEGFTAGQRRADGRWIARVPEDAVGALRVVDRADLHRLLLAGLTPDTVRTDAEAASATPLGALTFRTDAAPPEAEERFDLIIGADGLHSRVRPVVDGGRAGPQYAGYSAWRGITSVPVDLSGQAGESVGHGRRFGIAPLADDRVYWFAVANMPEDAVFADEKSTVEQMFAGWHSPIAELIAATDAEAVRRTPIADLSSPLPRFQRGRIVLLGDAAHAMTPNLGQGGGQALEDAATLTALLTPLLSGHTAGRRTDLDAVLHRYDALRRPRSQSIAKKSRFMGRVFQLESPLLAGARDAIFSAVPARLIAAQAARVQRWSPPAPPR